MSLGVNFVRCFRWLLILLAALVIEKSLDAIVYGIAEKHFFLEPTIVKSPPPIWNIFPANHHYITGILQFCALLLILLRYFLCIIEPIAAVCRSTDRHKRHELLPHWRRRLSQKVGWLQLVIISGVAIFDFVIIYHAALSVATLEQWLAYLLLLPVIDLLLFLVPPLLVTVYAWLGIVLTFILGLLYSFKEGCKAFGGVFTSKWRHIFSMSQEEKAASETPLDRGRKLRNRMRRFCIMARKSLRESFRIFAVWNCFDFLVAFWALYLFKRGLSDVNTAVVMLSATLCISLANLMLNKRYYRQYLDVLSIGHAI